jgi:hypothetical protein
MKCKKVVEIEGGWLIDAGVLRVEGESQIVQLSFIK